jgi:hypothetical protein
LPTASRDLVEKAVNTIRLLAADGVQQANSGHPGMPMGAADMAFVLWTRHLRFDPRAPRWIGRDRFLLSAGHGSMLLYSLLHLAGFDCIVTGVRAFNTRPRLRALAPRLLEYVAAGGRLVVQYNTSDEGLKDRIGPFPFTIARDRVTVEQAEVRILAPSHPLLARPNRIDADDFSGWVQERGLQFANPFDPRYETPLAGRDGS